MKSPARIDWLGGRTVPPDPLNRATFTFEYFPITPPLIIELKGLGKAGLPKLAPQQLQVVQSLSEPETLPL